MNGPSRREVLAGAGGLAIGMTLVGFAAVPPFDDTAAFGVLGQGDPTSLNAWLRIGPDGLATIRMGASEMGQGVFTALPMLVAEELDLPFASVRVESAPTGKEYRRDSASFPGMVQLTGGSESVRGYWKVLREAGASARAMLVATAAARWDVPAGDCRTEDGAVHHGEQRLSYGELAAEASLRRPPKKVQLKDPSEFRLLGTSPPRPDVPAKTDGSAIFGIDISLPGLLNATVRACPHYGGSLVSFEDTAARAVPGVVDVFAMGDVVAVVADTFWHAKKAAALVTIQWDKGLGAGLDDAAIEARLQEGLSKARTRFARGGAPKDLTIEATYAVPFLDHAPIEPLNATVWVQPDRVDVWVGTQAQARVKRRTAKATGVPSGSVFVHTTLLGGGFGRRGFDDFTDYAVQIALRVGKPVKTIWTREETFTHGFYRPATLCRQRAALGADGLPTDWHVEMASQNILEQYLPPLFLGASFSTETATGGMSHSPYSVERQRVDYGRVRMPIPVGWWRSVHGSHNGFFRECFLDELAHAAGKDPVDVRRALLQESPRDLAVFERALSEAGLVPAGLSRGVAVFDSFGSYVAQVVDLEVIKGEVFVRRITAAVDCGLVVHPEIVQAQIAGAATMGLSAALFGKLSFVDGAVQETNFHQYRLLAMRQAPRVDVHIVASSEAPGGVGEVGLPPLAGALGNAIFAATGQRIRRLPVGDQLKG